MNNNFLAGNNLNNYSGPFLNNNLGGSFLNNGLNNPVFRNPGAYSYYAGQVNPFSLGSRYFLQPGPFGPYG